MAIIVEDGSGLSNSETYISVAEADQYHSDRGNAAWAALTVAVKEQVLRQSCDYLTAMYFESWVGVKYTAKQALDWPRAAAYKKLGYPAFYTVTEIPTMLKQCQAELALIASTTPLLPTSQTRGKKRVKVGPIEVEYDGFAPTAPKFLWVMAKIGILLRTSAQSTMTVRLERG